MEKKWTVEDLKFLKKKYEECKDGGTFMFNDYEVLKDYAKYLIEYLEGEFGKKKDRIRGK